MFGVVSARRGVGGVGRGRQTTISPRAPKWLEPALAVAGNSQKVEETAGA